MVHSKSNVGFPHFLGEHYGMEIAVLLLLTVPLTAASPLRPSLSSAKDSSQAVDTVEASGLEASEAARGQDVPFLKIVPFNSRDRHLDMDATKRSFAGRLLRPRRAAQAGCKLGTCHVQILANTLYHISKTSGKEKSKNANDPKGYGR